MEYTIRMICAQFDIKPDTLRKWEKRKLIPASRRRENGYRYYTDEDLPRIEKFVLSRSKKPEALSGITPDNIKENIPKRNPTSLSPEREEAIIKAIENLDRVSLRREFELTLSQQSPLEAVENDWIPILLKIGDIAMEKKGLWIAREHFASSSIRQWILKLLDNHSADGQGKILMTTPEGDLHELGMLFALLKLQAAGVQCTYLGPNLPHSTLLETIKETGITNVSLTINKSFSRSQLKNTVRSILKVAPKANVFFAGPASFPLANLIREEKAVFLGTNLEIATQKIKNVLKN